MCNQNYPKARFKKNAVPMLLLTLGVMLVILAGAHRPAKAYEMADAITVSEENALYLSPSLDAEIIGIYYPATRMQGDVIDGGWFHAVILPEVRDDAAPDFSGYMRMEDILLYDVLMERKEMPYFCPVGEVTAETDFITALDDPKVIARIGSGVVVEILGVRSDWLHVRVGDMAGFLPKAHVMYTGEKAHLYYGPPARGYMVTHDGSPSYGKSIEIYAFPDSSHKLDEWLYARSLAVFSSPDARGWLQIRARVARRIKGFINDDAGNFYWLKDLKVTENIRKGQGEWRSGQDFPAGLYTFSAPMGGHGSIEVTGGTPLLYHTFDSSGEPYSMYLPEDVTVLIGGDGELIPMDESNTLAEANGWQSSGGGRFLIGENLIHPQGLNELRVCIKPGEAVGYYALSTFDDEAGVGGRPNRVMVTPEEGESVIYVEPGMFVEFRNCSFRFDFGNG